MPLFSFRRNKSRNVAVFDGQDYRKAMLAAAAWLEQHRDQINKLNVFPVPDGDTGTNMAATMRAATAAVADSTDTNVSVVASKLSEGAIRGARGNSGVILSQILRGISVALDKKATFTAQEFADALQTAAQNAYKAVIKPVEGTILTVIRESAEAAKAAVAKANCDLTTLMQEVVAKARQTVAHTPELLPMLKQAGVVDAGGQGLTTIFEGFLRYTRGESTTMPSRASMEMDVAEIHRGAVSIDEEFGYEVVFLLRGEKLDMEGIRNAIVEMGGNSTVVAGDETIIKVHTHTLNPGKILDYGVSLGSLEDINIENLQAQSLTYAAASAKERGVADTSTATAGAINQGNPTSRRLAQPYPPVGDVAMVAVVAGPGFEQVFSGLNVNALVQGGQTMNPSTQELLDGVNSLPVSKVVLLPNNGNIIMSARQVNDLTDKDVRVIPTRSMPQGVAAMMAYNFDADFANNVAAMESAIGDIVTGEITIAVRDALIDGVNVQTGNTIGLVNDVLVAAGNDPQTVLHQTLEKMDVANHEVVTLYYGEGVSANEAQRTAQAMMEWYPDQPVEVVHGGQPYYTFVISAE
ncbi:MAG: DAK2 domain-containing protein [Ktedonobacterales bacterium]|nr:DAK2 domain-containing protein [Ktedonobacterales bacterium]